MRFAAERRDDEELEPQSFFDVERNPASVGRENFILSVRDRVRTGSVRAGAIWRVRPDGTGLKLVLPAPRHPDRTGVWSYFPVAWTPDDEALLGQIGTPHAWDVGIRIDVATGRFARVHGYPVSLSRNGRFALAFGGRATGGPDGGPQPPEWIAALPFGHSGRRRVLALGDVCCPSWNR